MNYVLEAMLRSDAWADDFCGGGDLLGFRKFPTASQCSATALGLVLFAPEAVL